MWQYGENGRMLEERMMASVENRFGDEKNVAGEVVVEEKVAAAV
jgi:hypothetical protein